MKAGVAAAIAWGGSRAIPAAAAGVAAVVVVLFLIGVLAGDVEPSSRLGVTFGIIAALTLVIVMTYSVRRAAPAVRRLGPTRWYLQVHLWGGILFLLLLLLHSDFRFPRAGLTFGLWALSIWVVATGMIGWALQQTLPRILEPATSLEVHLQRIPEFVDELRLRAASIARHADPRVRSYYEQRIGPGMASPRMVTAVLVRNPRALRPASGDADILARTVSPEGREALEALRALQATKHDLDVQFTLQRILHGWLFIHVPVAVALLGLVVVHIFFVLYF